MKLERKSNLVLQVNAVRSFVDSKRFYLISIALSVKVKLANNLPEYSVFL